MGKSSRRRWVNAELHHEATPPHGWWARDLPHGVVAVPHAICLRWHIAWVRCLADEPDAFDRLMSAATGGLEAGENLRPRCGFAAPGIFAVLAQNPTYLADPAVSSALDRLWLRLHPSLTAAAAAVPVALASLAWRLHAIDGAAVSLALLRLALMLGDPGRAAE